MQLIYTGSESQIYLDEDKILKYRQAKPYRLSVLDKRIRLKRTQKELKIIKKLKDKKINVPDIISDNQTILKKLSDFLSKAEEKIIKDDGDFLKEVQQSTVVMAHINGKTLYSQLISGICDHKTPIDLGNLISQIHTAGIIHGDLTPSNILLFEENLFVIDFGLSFFSVRMEDRAVDVWMLEKIFKSLFSECKLEGISTFSVFDLFIKGYLQNMDDQSRDAFISKLTEVRERGRKIGC